MWETKQFWGTIDFHSIFFSYNGSQWCPKTFFKISSFVFGRTNKFKEVCNYLRVSKWWQNFHFWVNYPFNKSVLYFLYICQMYNIGLTLWGEGQILFSSCTCMTWYAVICSLFLTVKYLSTFGWNVSQYVLSNCLWCQVKNKLSQSCIIIKYAEARVCVSLCVPLPVIQSCSFASV